MGRRGVRQMDREGIESLWRLASWVLPLRLPREGAAAAAADTVLLLGLLLMLLLLSCLPLILLIIHVQSLPPRCRIDKAPLRATKSQTASLLPCPACQPLRACSSQPATRLEGAATTLPRPPRPSPRHQA